jgi:hypothetical protein
MASLSRYSSVPLFRICMAYLQSISCTLRMPTRFCNTVIFLQASHGRMQA